MRVERREGKLDERTQYSLPRGRREYRLFKEWKEGRVVRREIKMQNVFRLGREAGTRMSNFLLGHIRDFHL